MNGTHICDRSGCPARALRHVELHGQDFHFCNHHWLDMSGPLVTELLAWPPGPERGAVGRTLVRAGNSGPAVRSL